MITVLLILFVIGVLLFVWKTPRDPELDEASARAVEALHTIRRQLDVAQFRAESRSEAVRLRRELGDELDQVDRRSWG